MQVKVHLKTQSGPIVIKDAHNAYEKGSFYCVMYADKKRVRKFPIADIFDVNEEEDAK